MKARYLLALLLVIGTSLRAASVVAEPFPPAKLTSLYIEKDEKGKATIVQMVGDVVIFKVTMGNQVLETITLHPAGEDWFKLIIAKVYAWAPKYYYPGQGPAWVIDFAMDDRKFTSEGMNEFPKEGHETDPQADPKHGPSVPFLLFWQAVLDFAGQKSPH
jgi:hypothetical protein